MALDNIDHVPKFPGYKTHLCFRRIDNFGDKSRTGYIDKEHWSIGRGLPI